MHCRGCEAIIESALKELPGIRSVRADYAQEKLKVTWNNSKFSLTDIFRVVEAKGYSLASVPMPLSRQSKLKTSLIVLLGWVGGALLILGASLT